MFHLFRLQVNKSNYQKCKSKNFVLCLDLNTKQQNSRTEKISDSGFCAIKTFSLKKSIE